MEANTERRLEEQVRRSVGGVARSVEELEERAMELRGHLEDALDSRASAGMDADAALSEALRAFGSPDRIRRSFIRQDLRALARESLQLPWSWAMLMGLDLTLHTTWYAYFTSRLAHPTAGSWAYLFVATSICFGIYWLALGTVQAGLRLRAARTDAHIRELGGTLVLVGIAVWMLLPGGMAAISLHDAVIARASSAAWQWGRALVLTALAARCAWQVRTLLRAR